ncbi:hypothetical protein BGZ65_001460 [Modicella reniformis]|uniref:F-box domain-containing protein n=1 Tax=Modicella reniformis TaxID=1440133 RepID=A0A9P6SQM0_9FUNG|nr:hypothetical protein BGZ65_001460 [Modicella reniformis]
MPPKKKPKKEPKKEPKKNHPLLIPEISVHVSRFVTLKDAITCTQVCRGWSDPFTSAVWYIIDFDHQKRFANLDPAIVNKHGHRVRVVKGIKQDSHLKALHSENVCALRSMTMVIQRSPWFQAYSLDLLRQNITGLTHLDIVVQANGSDPSTFSFPLESFFPCAGSQTLKLTELKIEHFTLSRDGLSSLLRTCPALKTLDLTRISIYSDLCSEPYHHIGLTTLRTSLQQIFQSDPSKPNAPSSLLVHFPRLRTLRIHRAPSSIPSPPSPPSPQAMKAEIARCCPQLNRVAIGGTDATTTIMLLTQIFWSLTNITISREVVSLETVMGILVHQETLTSLTVFAPYSGYLEQDEVPTLKDYVSTPAWAIQLIPQTCSGLSTIMLSTVEMDMDDIEKIKWSCINLERLYIRIRGLDTKEKIDKAITMWVVTRKLKKEGRLGDLSPRQQSLQIKWASSAIVTRVAQHLVRFEKLRTGDQTKDVEDRDDMSDETKNLRTYSVMLEQILRHDLSSHYNDVVRVLNKRQQEVTDVMDELVTLSHKTTLLQLPVAPLTPHQQKRIEDEGIQENQGWPHQYSDTAEPADHFDRPVLSPSLEPYTNFGTTEVIPPEAKRIITHY